MSELLRVNRETPYAASELASRLAQYDSRIGAVAREEEVVIHTDNALIELLHKLVVGISIICSSVAAVLMRSAAHSEKSLMGDDAPASSNDDHVSGMDKAA